MFDVSNISGSTFWGYVNISPSLYLLFSPALYGFISPPAYTYCLPAYLPVYCTY